MKAFERQQMLQSNALTGIYELRGATDRSRGIIEPMCDDDEAMAISEDLHGIMRGERPMTAEEDAAIGHIVREWQRLEAAGEPDAEDDTPFAAWMETWWPKLPEVKFVSPVGKGKASAAAPVSTDIEGDEQPF